MSEIQYTLKPLDGPIYGPAAPPRPKNIFGLIKVLLTIYDRFGDTCVDYNLKWGAAALNNRANNPDGIKQTAEPEHVRPDGSVMHDLKCWPEYFTDIESGVKTFEYRGNDRGYCVGDLLFLREFCPAKQEYTGRSVLRFVTYIMHVDQSPFAPAWMLPIVIMAIVPFVHQPGEAIN